MNKVIFSVVCFVALSFNVLAGDGISVKIGNNYYETLSLAIENAFDGDTITMLSSVTIEKPQLINKNITINLNGNNISGKSYVFKVQNGTLNLTGKGKVNELEPYFGAIVIKGSENSYDSEYSVVNVSSDVILEGWTGIFIDQYNGKGYGIKVSFDGTINTYKDSSGDSGAGIYVNGTIKDKINYPDIKINKTAKINSIGNGLYMAGYSNVLVDGAYIEANDAGIAIKSGILTINDGDVIVTGIDEVPTTLNPNGINRTGTTFQIESNNGYAGDIVIDIKGGNFISKNSNVMYEYGNNTKVSSINISGGKFKSEASKDVFNLSNSFKTKHNKFISGGEFSSNPSDYLKNGYSVNHNYQVLKESILSVSENVTKTENVNVGTIIFLIIMVLISILVYLIKGKKILKKIY